MVVWACLCVEFFIEDALYKFTFWLIDLIDCITYDCNGWTQTTVRQKQIFNFQFSKWFVGIRIKRRPFNPCPWTNDCIPAENAVQYAAVLLQTKQHQATVSDNCILPTLVVGLTYSSFGDRNFAAAAPQVWNSLPPSLRLCGLSYGQFRRSLKIFLFGQWGRSAL